MEKLRWGIIGLGNIAHSFSKDLKLLERHELVAVASRSEAKASAFAEKYSAKNHHSSYEAILEDPEVDILYIATPHDLHSKWSIAGLKKGKHVLCEKPLGVNSNEVQSMIDVARKEERFFMEALWSRFIPCLVEVFEKCKNGRIGQVRYLRSEFGFAANPEKSSRLFLKERAGGALLDVGIYPVFLSYMLLGMPDSITAAARFSENEIDLQTSIILQYPNAQALLYGGVNAMSDMRSWVSGSKGSISIEPRWHESTSYVERLENQVEQVFKVSKQGKGYAHEIEACYDSIMKSEIENQLWSHQDSSNLIKILDEVRRQIGLKYSIEV